MALRSTLSVALAVCAATSAFAASAAPPSLKTSAPRASFRNGKYTLLPGMQQSGWTDETNPFGSLFVGFNATPIGGVDLWPGRAGSHPADLAVSDSTGLISLYRRQEKRFQNYTCLASNGGVIYSGDAAGGISAWVAAGARNLFAVRNAHAGPVQALGFDGSRLFSVGQDGVIRAWDQQSGLEGCQPDATS